MKDTAQIIQQVELMGTQINIIENPNLKGDGEYREYKHDIHIKPVECMLDDTATEDEQIRRYNEVKRHELLHAVFSICGLDTYSSDEVLIDFLAVLYPHIRDVFMEAQCEDVVKWRRIKV